MCTCLTGDRFDLFSASVGGAGVRVFLCGATPFLALASNMYLAELMGAALLRLGESHAHYDVSFTHTPCILSRSGEYAAIYLEN